MKNMIERYPMKEGETSNTWYNRVEQEFYEQYADKTQEQMDEIYEQYKKDHPEEFEGMHARMQSPELGAIGRKRVELFDERRNNTVKRGIDVKVHEDGVFTLSVREKGNDEFLKDVHEAIKKGYGTCLVLNGIRYDRMYASPEAKEALMSVFKKHNLDTSLLAGIGMSRANAGIKKQPNPTEVKVPERKSTSYFKEEIKQLNLSESSLAKEPLPKHVEQKGGKLVIGKDFGWRAQDTIRTLYDYATEFGLSAQKYADKDKTKESYRLVLDDTPANRAFINAAVYREANPYSWMERSPKEVSRALKRSDPNSVVSHLKKNKELIEQKLPTGVLKMKNADLLEVGNELGDKAQEIVRALYERGREIGLDMDKNAASREDPSSYRLRLADTPENRAFINANMTRDGKDLVPEDKAMAKMLGKDASKEQQPSKKLATELKSGKTSSYFKEEIKQLNLSESSLAKDPLPEYVEQTGEKLVIGKDLDWRAQLTVRTLYDYATELGLSVKKYADKDKTEESYRLVLDNTPENRAFINASLHKRLTPNWMHKSPKEVSMALKSSDPNSVISHLKKNKELIDQKLPTGVLEMKNADLLKVGDGLGNKAQEIVRALYERGRAIGLDMGKHADSREDPSSYSLWLADTPENRAFINANMTRDGKNLVPEDKAMAKMLGKDASKEQQSSKKLATVLKSMEQKKPAFAISFSKTDTFAIADAPKVPQSQTVGTGSIPIEKLVKGKGSR